MLYTEDLELSHDIPYSTFTFSTQKSQIEDQKISKSNMYLVKTERNNSVLRQDIVHFLEKMRTREFAFEIFWPLQQSICTIKNMQYVRCASLCITSVVILICKPISCESSVPSAQCMQFLTGNYKHSMKCTAYVPSLKVSVLVKSC